MLGPGRAIVYRGEAYDIVRITRSGDVLIRNFLTQEEIWIDYFHHGFKDPYADPGALLEALAQIANPGGAE